MNLLPLSPVADRLKEPGLCPSLRLVGSAADLAAVARSKTPANVAAFVVLLGADNVQTLEGSGPLRQVLQVTVAVVLRVTLSGAEGAAGLKQLETPAGEVRAALFGWMHPDGQLKFTISAEALEDFDPATGVTLYRLDFTTRVRLQEPTS